MGLSFIMLLVLASTVILGSKSRETHDIFYCLKFETPPTWRARSPYLYSSGTGWPSYTPESESYITTDSQSASLSWNKAPIWGLRQDFYFSLTVAGLLMMCALSDERTGLSFTIAAGPRQGSHSRV
jgi:hypothetical protein